jgi:hypothetical protein
MLIEDAKLLMLLKFLGEMEKLWLYQSSTAKIKQASF